MHFSIHWIGFSLREYNSKFTSLLIPHCEVLSPFYKSCISDFKEFKSCTDVDFGIIYSVKVMYSILLKNVEHLPNIVTKNRTLDFHIIFKNLFNKFIEKFSRDIMYKIVHRVLPVNRLMYYYGIYKVNKCSFCSEQIETLTHLFYECTYVKPLLILIRNWIMAISQGKVFLNLRHILFLDISNVDDKNILGVILCLIALYCKCIWLNRNAKKFDKQSISKNNIYMNFLSHLRMRILVDFIRLERFNFNEHWCTSNLFCNINDEDECIVNL